MLLLLKCFKTGEVKEGGRVAIETHSMVVWSSVTDRAKSHKVIDSLPSLPSILFLLNILLYKVDSTDQASIV
jgi:hypothetical protein